MGIFITLLLSGMYVHCFQELFVADGEGLPRSLVEEQARSYRQILSLFSLQVDDSHFHVATSS